MIYLSEILRQTSLPCVSTPADVFIVFRTLLDCLKGIIYEDCYRKISQGNSIRWRIRYCFPVFCVKIKFYREVCQSKLLAISVWRFIINIHDIRITTVAFTVQ